MNFLDIFIIFINTLLGFQILSIPLYVFLFSAALIQFVIYMINSLKDR